VAGYALRYSRQARFVRLALVDGTPGLAIVVLGRIIGALGFTFRDEAISEIEMIDAPGRLRDVTVPPAGRQVLPAGLTGWPGSGPGCGGRCGS
jgi:RNA polymerase sigma-70 factor (ECF subfamily)